jgi:hypothetical protein
LRGYGSPHAPADDPAGVDPTSSRRCRWICPAPRVRRNARGRGARAVLWSSRPDQATAADLAAGRLEQLHGRRGTARSALRTHAARLPARRRARGRRGRMALYGVSRPTTRATCSRARCASWASGSCRRAVGRTSALPSASRAASRTPLRRRGTPSLMRRRPEAPSTSARGSHSWTARHRRALGRSAARAALPWWAVVAPR